jgi:hypothetical protein
VAFVVEDRVVPEPVGLVDGAGCSGAAAGGTDAPVMGIDVIDVDNELAAGIAEVLRRVEPVLASNAVHPNSSRACGHLTVHCRPIRCPVQLARDETDRVHQVLLAGLDVVVDEDSLDITSRSHVSRVSPSGPARPEQLTGPTGSQNCPARLAAGSVSARLATNPRSPQSVRRGCLTALDVRPQN